MGSSHPGQIEKGADAQQLQDRGWRRVSLAVLASLSWMMVSSSLIFVNRLILVDYGFPYPFIVSGMGMLMSSVLSFSVCKVLRWVDANQEVSLRFYITRIMPIGFFMASTLFTGNQVYLYLGVSIIQILKALTPVITMLALFAARLESPTVKMIAAVLSIAFGTAVAAYGESELSTIGLIFIFASEGSEAARLVMTQFLLVGLKFHPIEGLMYLAPACSFWLLIGAVVLEMPSVAEEHAWAVVINNRVLFALAACMGFAVNSLAYTTIKLASALTLKVLGTVKNTLIVVCAVIFLGEEVSLLQASGYFVSIAGFASYNYIKLNQIAAAGQS